MVAGVGDLSASSISTLSRWLRRRSREIARALVMAMHAFTFCNADAHAVVVSATPAINAPIAPGDLDVRVQLNSEIDRKRSRLLLQAPDASVTNIELVPNGP